MKKTVAALLALILALSLCACGGKGGTSAPGSSVAQEDTSVTDGEETGMGDGGLMWNLFTTTIATESYIVDYMAPGYDGIIVYEYFAADYSVTFFREGQQIRFLKNMDGMWLIDDVNMTYRTVESEDAADLPPLPFVGFDAFTDPVMGTAEQDGMTYAAETYVQNGDDTRYLFDGQTLAYIVSRPGAADAVVLTVYTVEAGYDEYQFTLPEGYAPQG